MMSLRPNVASRVYSAAGRVSVSRVAARQINDTAYPFTKPDGTRKTAEPKASGQTAYPFTKAGEPTKVAAPTRPVERGGPIDDASEIISAEAGSRSSPYGTPDYAVAPDYRTHAFSPVPLRVKDGSEPTDTTAAAVISGAPTELQARRVRIYKPAKTATQSGDWHSHHWKMDWDILQKGHRWENPLMGWQSSSDSMQGTRIEFKSKEDAIRFAEKQGYEYFVQEPNERKRIPKAYATQFVHSPGKLKQIRTK